MLNFFFFYTIGSCSVSVSSGPLAARGATLTGPSPRFRTLSWSRTRRTWTLSGSCLTRRWPLNFFLLFHDRILLGLSLIGTSSSAGSNFDWTKSQIPDSIMKSHKEDLDFIRILLDQTLTCSECKKRHVIEGQLSGVQYCDCKGRPATVYGQKSEGKINERTLFPGKINTGPLRFLFFLFLFFFFWLNFLIISPLYFLPFFPLFCDQKWLFFLYYRGLKYIFWNGFLFREKEVNNMFFNGQILVCVSSSLLTAQFFFESICSLTFFSLLPC